MTQKPVIYRWQKSCKSSRTILGLYRDGLLIASLVLDGRWRPCATDAQQTKWWANMRPDDRAEVEKKLAELNAGQESA
jgi:hypothetical protein